MKNTTNTSTTKRFLSGLITAAMTVSVLATSLMSTVTAATPNPTFSLQTESKTAYAGTDVTITANLENSCGFRGLVCKLSYDGSLGVGTVKNGDIFDMINGAFAKENELFSIVTASGLETSDNGEIAKVRFHIPDDAEAGTVYNFNWVDITASTKCNPVPNFDKVGTSITVIDEPVELSDTSYKFGVIGQQKQLSVNTKRNVTWISTNEDVATVDDNGLVTAIGIGTTKVYAVVGSQKLVCNVNVDVRGHVNGTEDITTNDASTILKQLSMEAAGANSVVKCNMLMADINGDGMLDTSDASLVLKFCSLSVIFPELNWNIVFEQMSIIKK